MQRVHPHTQLVLIGEGPAESAVRKLVTSLWPTHSPVRLYPWQTHIASLMKAADIYALSSDHEGYAMVLGEALAAGVPVVATDVGCAGELVLPDVHGLIVPTRDVEAYANALSRLVSDTQLRTRYGTAGVETMSRFAQSGDTYTKSLVATWRSLVR